MYHLLEENILHQYKAGKVELVVGIMVLRVIRWWMLSL